MALDIYLSGDTPRGCFTVVTAASDAVADPEIGALALDGFVKPDKAFASCFRRAIEKGEVSATVEIPTLGNSLRHSLHHRAPRPRIAQGTPSHRQRCVPLTKRKES